ncbi:MAG: YraN family protein [Candidatus Aminicenantes bacterium]|nr:YraN family protein [Candidatus Aminicenantes bacterium]
MNEVKDPPQVLGRKGERIAAAFLRRKGFQIMETGFRFGQGEIDIIARDGEYLVFVEVKTRTDLDYGGAEEAVDRKKRRQIRKVAMGYLYQQHRPPPFCRFDVVAVCPDSKSNRYNVFHFPDAFE